MGKQGKYQDHRTERQVAGGIRRESEDSNRKRGLHDVNMHIGDKRREGGIKTLIMHWLSFSLSLWGRAYR